MRKRYTDQASRLMLPTAVLALAVTGLVLLQSSDAATATVPYEAERGAISGATTVNDTTASGGVAVRFAAGSTVRPIALVYRGPGAGCEDCSEAWAALVQQSPYNFDVRYVGPGETLKMTAATFAGATLYVQPGGDGTIEEAAELFGDSAMKVVRDFVANGGHYVGSCMGAYMAGQNPGIGLLYPGDTDQYITQPGAIWTSEEETVLPIKWRGQPRLHYYQDGARMLPSGVAGEVIISTFTNGDINALSRPYGKGRLAVSGSHPEARRDWFTDKMWAADTDGLDAADGLDLINAAMAQ